MSRASKTWARKHRRLLRGFFRWAQPLDRPITIDQHAEIGTLTSVSWIPYRVSVMAFLRRRVVRDAVAKGIARVE